ncbi:MAG: SLBB domain-containing protein, partial [Acidimicrobiales bacterium]
LPADRSRGQLATTVRVPLDSTYLFERDSLGRYVGAAGLPFPAGGTAPEVPLEPYDNALILRQPNFELQRTVAVTGQVRYPGFYALQSKDDRLAGLIARAGGLTPQAYPEGIRFYRALNDAGRINLKLRDALRDSTSRDNIILQPGDSLHIPEYLPSVRVTGAVNAPGSVLWKRGASADYYVSAAGGFARLADDGATSVRFANGEVRTRSKFLFFTNWPEPDPGGEVFVPAKAPGERRDWTGVLAATAALASVMASLVAIVVSVNQ